MSLANFKPKRTAAASRGFLATARLSCLDNVLLWYLLMTSCWYQRPSNCRRFVARHCDVTRTCLSTDGAWLQHNGPNNLSGFSVWSTTCSFWTRKAGPKKLSVTYFLLVAISSLKIPKAFIIRSATKLCTHIRAHIPHRSTGSDFQLS